MKERKNKILSIIEHVKKLDWNYPIDVQNDAIVFLSQIDIKHIHLIFDKTQKSTWENAVKVIDLMGYPKNAPLLSNLIWLLQDVNWPGALYAIKVLSNLEKSVVIPLIEKALLEADSHDDFMWIGGLKMLALQANIHREDFSKISFWSIFQKSDF